MGAITVNAALPLKSTLQLRGHRPCALTSQHPDAKLQLRRDYVRMSRIERNQAVTVGTTPIIINCNPVAVFVDRAAASKDAATKIGESHTTEEMSVESMTQLENALDVYCDIMTDSMSCQALQYPASRIREELADSSEITGSKKPQRLSCTSWDLLD